MNASTAAPPPQETPNYVIVGGSFAAILNHVTLRRARNSRIEGYHLIHVNADEAWFHNAQGKLGQWPILLSFPGCTIDFGEDPRSFLSAPRFSACMRHALEELRTTAFKEQVGQLRRIVRHGAGDYSLELTNDGKTIVLRAQRIDVCMGPGEIRHWPHVMPDPLRAEYFADGDLTTFRRVMSGEDFLGTTAIKKGSRICVVGDGATAAWVVERSGDQFDAQVVWVGREFGVRSFLSSERNDSLALGVLERRFLETLDEQEDLPLLDWVITSEVRSGRDWLTLIEGFDVETVDLLGAKVAVRVKRYDGDRDPFAPPNPRVPTTEELSGVFSEPFDQVVFAIGRRGETITAAVHTLFEQSSSSDPEVFALRSPKDGRVLGLCSDNSAIRVLGASAMAHELMQDILRTARGKTPPGLAPDDYSQTLCAQAKRDGFVPAAVNIAEANGWYEEWSDERAPLWQLTQRYGGDAQRIALERAQRISPSGT